MGKGILDEHHPLFGGCYAGANSLKPVIEGVESADFVLYVGSLKSDFNSGSFSVNIPEEHTIKLHSWTTTVGYATFPTTDIRHVLPRLIPAFEEVMKTSDRKPATGESLEEKIKTGHLLPLYTKPDGDKIVHSWLWSRLGSWFQKNGKHSVLHRISDGRHYYYRDGHLVVWPPVRPDPQLRDVHFPDALGRHWLECRRGARRRSGRRGEGGQAAHRPVCRRRLSAARECSSCGGVRLERLTDFKTVQEIGTMIRRGLRPYLFVLNNDGYEIERQSEYGPRTLEIQEAKKGFSA